MLELRGVTKTFHKGTPGEVTALRDVSLKVDAGEFVILIGSNGSGKTTLLNAIAGVYPLDEGRILLNGVDITNLPEHVRARSIGRVRQDPLMGTAPSMTVEENLVLGAVRGTAPGLRRAVRRARRDTFRSVLAGFGLDLGERLEARGRELSGGQRQALSLAIATFVQPRLLLLDEHVASLDPRMTDVVMTMTDNLVRGQGLTTLMVTHNLRHALTFGARLLIMHRGGIVEDLDGKRRSALTSSQLTARFADLAEQNHVGRSKAEER